MVQEYINTVKYSGLLEVLLHVFPMSCWSSVQQLFIIIIITIIIIIIIIIIITTQ